MQARLAREQASLQGGVNPLGLGGNVLNALRAAFPLVQQLGGGLGAAASQAGSLAGGMGGLSGAAGVLGLAIGGVVLALGSLVAAAIKGLDQVKQLQNAFAVLKANGESNLAGVSAGLDRLKQSGNAAAETFTKGELAASLADIVKAGVSTRDALVLLSTSTRLAASENQNLTVSSSMLLKNLRQYQLGVQDAARVGDELSKSGLLAAGSVADLSTGLGIVAGTGRAAKVEMYDLLGMLVELDNKGMSAADVGANGLRSALAALADITPKGRGALHDLGVATEDASGHARTAGDILKDLSAALNGMGIKADVTTGELIGNGDALQRVSSIMDTRAAAAVLSLTGDWKTYSAQIKDSSGSLDSYSRTMLDTLDGNQRKLKASLADLGGNITNLVAAPLSNVLGTLNDIITKLNGGVPGFNRFLEQAGVNGDKLDEQTAQKLQRLVKRRDEIQRLLALADQQRSRGDLYYLLPWVQRQQDEMTKELPGLISEIKRITGTVNAGKTPTFTVQDQSGAATPVNPALGGAVVRATQRPLNDKEADALVDYCDKYVRLAFGRAFPSIANQLNALFKGNAPANGIPTAVSSYQNFKDAGLVKAYTGLGGLNEGDAVFYTDGGQNHVGVYVGNGFVRGNNRVTSRNTGGKQVVGDVYITDLGTPTGVVSAAEVATRYGVKLADTAPPVSPAPARTTPPAAPAGPKPGTNAYLQATLDQGRHLLAQYNAALASGNEIWQTKAKKALDTFAANNKQAWAVIKTNAKVNAPAVTDAQYATAERLTVALEQAKTLGNVLSRSKAIGQATADLERFRQASASNALALKSVTEAHASVRTEVSRYGQTYDRLRRSLDVSGSLSKLGTSAAATVKTLTGVRDAAQKAAGVELKANGQSEKYKALISLAADAQTQLGELSKKTTQAEISDAATISTLRKNLAAGEKTAAEANLAQLRTSLDAQLAAQKGNAAARLNLVRRLGTEIQRGEDALAQKTLKATQAQNQTDADAERLKQKKANGGQVPIAAERLIAQNLAKLQAAAAATYQETLGRDAAAQAERLSNAQNALYTKQNALAKTAQQNAAAATKQGQDLAAQQVASAEETARLIGQSLTRSRDAQLTQAQGNAEQQLAIQKEYAPRIQKAAADEALAVLRTRKQANETAKAERIRDAQANIQDARALARRLAEIDAAYRTENTVAYKAYQDALAAGQAAAKTSVADAQVQARQQATSSQNLNRELAQLNARFQTQVAQGKVTVSSLQVYQQALEDARDKVAQLPPALQGSARALLSQGAELAKTGQGVVNYNSELGKLKDAVKDWTYAELQAARARVVAAGGDQQKLALIDAEIKKYKTLTTAQVAQADAESKLATAGSTVSGLEGERDNKLAAAKGNLAETYRLAVEYGARIQAAQEVQARSAAAKDILAVQDKYAKLLGLAGISKEQRTQLEADQAAETLAINTGLTNTLAKQAQDRLTAETEAKRTLDDRLRTMTREAQATIRQDVLDGLKRDTAALEAQQQEELDQEGLTEGQKLAIRQRYQPLLLAQKAREVEAARAIEVQAENDRYQAAVDAAKQDGTFAAQEENLQRVHTAELTRINQAQDDAQRDYRLNVMRETGRQLLAAQKETSAGLLDEARGHASDILDGVDTSEAAQRASARRTLEFWRVTYAAMGLAGRAAVDEIDAALKKLDQAGNKARTDAGKLVVQDPVGVASQAAADLGAIGKPDDAGSASAKAAGQFDSLRDTYTRKLADLRDALTQFADIRDEALTPDQQQVRDGLLGTQQLYQTLLDNVVLAALEAGDTAAVAFTQAQHDRIAEAALQLAEAQKNLGESEGQVDTAAYRRALVAYRAYWAERVGVLKTNLAATKEGTPEYEVAVSALIDANGKLASSTKAIADADKSVSEDKDKAAEALLSLAEAQRALAVQRGQDGDAAYRQGLTVALEYWRGKLAGLKSGSPEYLAALQKITELEGKLTGLDQDNRLTRALESASGIIGKNGRLQATISSGLDGLNAYFKNGGAGGGSRSVLAAAAAFVSGLGAVFTSGDEDMDRVTNTFVSGISTVLGKLATGDTFGAILAGAATVVSTLVDIFTGGANSVKKAKESIASATSGVRLFDVSKYARTVSVGGFFGFLGFKKAEIDQESIDIAKTLGDALYEAVSGGLLDGIKAGKGSFTELSLDVRKGLSAQILQGLIDGFLKSAVFQASVQPFLDQYIAAMKSGNSQALAAAAAGLQGAITAGNAQLQTFYDTVLVPTAKNLGVFGSDTGTGADTAQTQPQNVVFSGAPAAAQFGLPTTTVQLAGASEFGPAVADFAAGSRELRAAVGEWRSYMSTSSTRQTQRSGRSALA